MAEDDLEQKLRGAFERARYGGEGPYNPDGDLFDVAADRLKRYREALTECVDALAFLRENGVYVWPNHPNNPEAKGRQALQNEVK